MVTIRCVVHYWWEIRRKFVKTVLGEVYPEKKKAFYLTDFIALMILYSLI